MSYHPNDADARLAVQMWQQQERDRANWFTGLPIEEQLAYLQEAAREASAMLTRIIAQREETR